MLHTESGFRRCTNFFFLCHVLQHTTHMPSKSTKKKSPKKKSPKRMSPRRMSPKKYKGDVSPFSLSYNVPLSPLAYNESLSSLSRNLEGALKNVKELLKGENRPFSSRSNANKVDGLSQIKTHIDKAIEIGRDVSKPKFHLPSYQEDVDSIAE